MKKIILTLLAAIAALSVDAQIIEVYRKATNAQETDKLEAIYGSDVKVNFRAKKNLTQYTGITIEDNTTNGSCGRLKTSGDDAASQDYVSQSWVQLWEGGPRFATNIIKTGTTNKIDASMYNNKDAVTDLWGSNWRTPTLAEITTMIGLCTISKGTIENNHGLLKIQSKQEGDKYVYIDGPVSSNELKPVIWTLTTLSDGATKKRFAVGFTYSTGTGTSDYGFSASAFGTDTSCLILPVLNE